MVRHDDVPPTTLDETFETLKELGQKRFGKVPPELVAAQVIAMSAGTDWPVRRAALEALTRRRRFGHRDGLAVLKRPARGAVFGRYTTGRAGKGRVKAKRGGGSKAGAGKRPYQTELSSLVPLRGSCDCADFLKSSLGVCKHLLCVLEDACSSAKRVATAEREQVRATLPADRLWWEPELALDGELDRLAGLRLGAKRAPAGWVPHEEARGREQHVWMKLRAGAEPLRLPPGMRLYSLDPERLAGAESRLSLLRKLARSGTAAEPAARALVDDELGRAERRHAARRAGGRASSHVESLQRKLYAYQREGVERFLDAGRLVLADDMGLGKTTQAVAACHALYTSRQVRRGLLVVPAALKPQWLREWDATTRVPAKLLEGRPDERAAQYKKLDKGFLIMGYEQLLRDFEHVRRLAPDMVVLDEAQRIKNWATKSAAYVKALSPTWRLVLTGTPMENRLEELASLLDWVDDLALAPKWRLDPWYTYDDGARNLDTLRTRLSPGLLRRRRAEVLSQLPPRTDTRVPVAMTERQRELHDDLLTPIKRLQAQARRRPLTQSEFLRLMSLLNQQRIISNGLGQLEFEEIWPTYQSARPDGALLEGLFSPKLLELRALVEELAVEQERKVVVFSQWRRMLRLAEWSLRDILGDAGQRAVFFTGAESTRQRTRSIVDFHDEPDTNVMFLSDAGGVGLNLQRAASACINLELPWNPAVLEQRISRIYRLGQKRPIEVFNLASEYGIESRIATLVSNKRALFSGIFDGTSDSVQFGGKASFMATVDKLVPEVPEVLDVGPAEDDDGELEADAARDGNGGDGDDAVAIDAARAAARGDAGTPAARAGAGNGAGAATGSSDARPGNGAGSAADGGDVTTLLSSVQVRRTESGGISIEAPPEAAAALMALFDGMAKLMAQASAGTGR